MYVNDIVKDFYEVLVGQQVLLIVGYDIDALCTCKMLQWLFQSEEIVYSLVPVHTVSEMKTAFENHTQDQVLKYVILINCGGTIDLVDAIEPNEELIIFVIDSHRPTDLCNVYSSSQVRLVALPGEDEVIPSFKDVFLSSDESEGEEESCEYFEGEGNDQYGSRKILNRAKETTLKQKSSREWEENKNRILFQYSQYSYNGRCSAIIIHELLWQISKGNLDVLWFAIVGLTSQFIFGNSTYETYMDDMQVLKKHVNDLMSKATFNCIVPNASSAPQQNNHAISICSEMDMNLALYRHWTVEASLKYSMCTAIQLKLWTKKGEQSLHQILAEMGLPIAQSRQVFCSMDTSLRHTFYDMMNKVADSHNINNLSFPSFSLRLGYKGLYCASDYVYSLLALMNFPFRQKSSSECFLECLDCLTRNRKDLLETGFEGSKKLLIMLFRQVQMCLDMKQVMSSHTFLYFVIQDGTVETPFYSHPQLLTMLARFMLKAYLGKGSNRKAIKLPLVALAPLGSDTMKCLVVGIPPVTEFTNRNYFGKAFEQAANVINCTPEIEYFDSFTIKIKNEDKTRFLDSLNVLLA